MLIIFCFMLVSFDAKLNSFHKLETYYFMTKCTTIISSY